MKREEEKNDGKIYRVIRNFVLSKTANEERNRQFEAEKKVFYSTMKKYFASIGNPQKVEVKSGTLDDAVAFTVTKVQKVSASFNTKALKKVLGKKYFSSVVTKRYTITDFDGFINYLKSLNADPKIIKSFLSADEFVNESALDNLVALGKVNKKQVKDCVSYTVHEPYFKIK